MPDQLIYRAKAYTRGATDSTSTIIHTGHTTREEAHRLLDAFLSAGIASGGHIEEHVQGLGWVVETEKDDPDTEARSPSHRYNKAIQGCPSIND